MKLKDLIANRDKLAKYDELKEWRERFESKRNKLVQPLNWEDSDMPMCMTYSKIPDAIREIILFALDAEIKKMEEE